MKHIHLNHTEPAYTSRIGRMRSVVAAAVLSVMTALLLPLPGCGPSTADRALDRAEALMEEHPDSAAGILDSIDQSSGFDQALFRLLDAQRRWLLDSAVIIPGDSLDIRPYLSMNDQSRILRAYYLNSVCRFSNGDYLTAITDASNACEIAEIINDNLWKARSLRIMGDIYETMYSQEKAMEYHHLAENAFRKAGKPDNADFCAVDRAACLINLGRYDEGIQIINTLNENAIKKRNHNLHKACMKLLLPVMIFSRNIPEALKAGEELDKLSKAGYFIPTFQDIIYIAELKNLCGETDQALEMLEHIDKSGMEESDSVTYMVAKARMLEKRGDIYQAFSIRDSIFNLQDRVIRRILTHSVIDSQNDLIVSKHNALKQENKSLLHRILLLAACLLCLAGAGIAWHAMSVRRHRDKTNELIARLSYLQSSMTQEMETSAAGRDRLLADIRRIYSNSWTLFNSMTIRYSELPASRKTNTEFARQYESLLQDLRDSGKLAAIEKSINRYFDNIISDFRRDVDFLTEDEYKLVVLVFAGFSPKSIAMILDISQRTLYQRRLRLIEKINKSSSTQKDRYSGILDFTYSEKFIG